jgi:isoleucyl-tRNA synthetase
MYKKVSTDLKFSERESEVLKFWKENKVFQNLMEKNGDKGGFTFYDGPPTANGKPHIGHVLTRAIKDLIPRYKTMKGYDVLRKAGWDTHGLPVEIEVEKILGINGKDDIERYGIEPFIKQCKESVWKYKGEWEQMSERVGFFADMENPYITYDNNFIESVWWSLKEIDKKGLIYKGHKVVPYCSRCGTAISSHEVAQGYKDVKEKSIFVKFKVKNTENEYFLAWTTTPWTLPSNVALCLNPKENYVKVEVDGEFYILAETLAPKMFENFKVVSKKKGSEYEKVEYEPLFDVGTKGAYFITCDKFVTLTDGTGIVHIAPQYGADDAEIGRRYNLPFVAMVGENGCFGAEISELNGLFAKDADVKIIKILAEKGLLFSELMYEHSYPHCWRCDTPLLYYARHSWFIKMTAVRDKLVENNKKINWLPAAIGSGRFGNFLEDVQDWSLSRERYWGTPLPIWVCEKCGKTHTVGSRKELHELSGCGLDIELHRPYVDEVKFPCPCGGTFNRTKEVIDCWYDSGAMPFAQFHYPFENKELFEKRFPADFISEAVDQTRGWFYTLLAISTLLFDEPPFKNCIVLGHINDRNGVKMSKSKGNVVDSNIVLANEGADAVRWYFYTVSPPWIPSNFAPELVAEMQRKFFGTLWNSYAFYVLYADIDKFNPASVQCTVYSLQLIDKWILSKLNSLVDFVTKSLDEYKITESGRALAVFVDELSNWYIRRSRDRFWGSGESEDKTAAFSTLYTCLSTLAKLTAPFTPFIAEQIYQNIERPFFEKSPLSVHLCDYPKANLKLINKDLEANMDKAAAIVELGRRARAKANVKNRQPLSKMSLVTCHLSGDFLDIVKEELNIKNIAVIESDAGFIDYEIKPQLKTLGKKLGSKLNDFKDFLSKIDGAKIVSQLKEKGIIKFEDYDILEEDLQIFPKNKEGFAAESENGLTVILDTALTPELLYEGTLRELVSKIQTLRKEANFNVTDHIEITFSSDNENIIRAMNSEELKRDVLAKSVTQCTVYSVQCTVIDINGIEVGILLKKEVK